MSTLDDFISKKKLPVDQTFQVAIALGINPQDISAVDQKHILSELKISTRKRTSKRKISSLDSLTKVVATAELPDQGLRVHFFRDFEDDKTEHLDPTTIMNHGCTINDIMDVLGANGLEPDLKLIEKRKPGSSGPSGPRRKSLGTYFSPALSLYIVNNIEQLAAEMGGAKRPSINNEDDLRRIVGERIFESIKQRDGKVTATDVCSFVIQLLEKRRNRLLKRIKNAVGVGDFDFMDGFPVSDLKNTTHTKAVYTWLHDNVPNNRSLVDCIYALQYKHLLAQKEGVLSPIEKKTYQVWRSALRNAEVVSNDPWFKRSVSAGQKIRDVQELLAMHFIFEEDVRDYVGGKASNMLEGIYMIDWLDSSDSSFPQNLNQMRQYFAAPLNYLCAKWHNFNRLMHKVKNRIGSGHQGFLSEDSSKVRAFVYAGLADGSLTSIDSEAARSHVKRTFVHQTSDDERRRFLKLRMVRQGEDPFISAVYFSKIVDLYLRVNGDRLLKSR